MSEKNSPGIPFIDSELVRWFVSPRLRDKTSYEAYNQRTVILITLVLGVLAPLYALLYLVVFDAPAMALPTGIASVLIVGSLFLYRIPAIKVAPSHLISVLVLVIITWLTLISGGVGSPVLPWLILAPITSSLFFNKKRWTLMWIALVLLTIGLLYLAPRLGLHAHNVLNTTWQYDLLSALSAVGLLVAVMSMFAIRYSIETWLLDSARREEQAKHRSEAQLRQVHQQASIESRQTLQALIDNSPEGIIVHTDGIVLYANPAFKALTAYDDQHSIEGLALTDLIAEAELAEVEQVMEILEYKDGLELHERSLRTRDGRTIPVEITVFRATFKSAEVLISLVRDLSKRREMQAKMMEMDRMIAVGTLAAGVAHEVNNPLAFVQSNVEYLLRYLKTDDAESPATFENLSTREAQETFADTLEGTHRIREIVSDLRTVSQQQDPNLEPVDLESPLRSAINMASNQIRQRARLVCEFEDLPVIESDASGLSQVFLNLLVNAAQAIEDGTPEDNEIRVTARQQQDHIVVDISDTGAGISEDIADRIFDPFVSSKSQEEGMGLGLSICRNIIGELNGRIEVESDLDQGTTFSVFIPKRLPPATIEQPRSDENFAVTQGRVVIIDDEPRLLTAQKRQLQHLFEVETYQEATEALTALQEGPRPQMILCDLQMPEVSGVEFYERLQEQHSELHHRVVFMTGGAFTEEVHQFLETTNPVMLEKPFGLDDILGRLEELHEADHIKASEP